VAGGTLTCVAASVTYVADLHEFLLIVGLTRAGAACFLPMRN
jgi:hypothetical protein